jgi:hypothetical protein
VVVVTDDACRRYDGESSNAMDGTPISVAPPTNTISRYVVTMTAVAAEGNRD